MKVEVPPDPSSIGTVIETASAFIPNAHPTSVKKIPEKAMPIVIGGKVSPSEGIIYTTSPEFMSYISGMGIENVIEPLKPRATARSTPSQPNIGMLLIINGLVATGEPIPGFPQSPRCNIRTSWHAPKPVEDEDPVKPLRYAIHELRSKYFAGELAGA